MAVLEYALRFILFFVRVALYVYDYVFPPKPLNPPCDLQKQSIELPGPERIRRCAFGDGKQILRPSENVRTLYDNFEHGRQLSRFKPCVGYRVNDGAYQWLTYEEIRNLSTNVGSGFYSAGLRGGAFVGICSKNNVEWILTEQACSAYSLVCVPLYDTLGPEAIRYIITHSGLRMIVVEQAKASKVREAVATLQNSPLNQIVIITNNQAQLSTEERDSWRSIGVEAISFQQLIELGAKNPQPHNPPQPNDLATVCFTSGTTGNPKGVCLSHSNILADMAAVQALAMYSLPAPTNDDAMISYLPLAHVFERLMQSWCYYNGARVGLSSGSTPKLMDDIAALQPAIFPAVPRVLNRIYDKIHGKVESSSLFMRTLFDFALNYKKSELKRRIVRKDSLVDKVVFKKIHAQLGGRVRLIVTGSAPINPDVLSFLRCCFGATVFEGYGQTECAAAATFTLAGEYESGHVGTPVPCNEIKLVDVPELKAFAAEGRGEICVRGANVFCGYYKDEEKTREVIDDDGWLHSGDVGMWLPNGALKIYDRKKAIFKLAQGEYIAPEKIENVYQQSPLVMQAFIHGSSLQASLVGLFVVGEKFGEWAAEKGFKGDIPVLCQDTAVAKQYLDAINAHAKGGGLFPFEMPRAITLLPPSHAFSLENGLLTPTFKTKRASVMDAYKPQIEAMIGKIRDFELAEKKSAAK